MPPDLRADIIEWDVANWGRVLDFWAPHLPIPNAKVLTLGERHGGLTLHFATQGFSVTATDLRGVSERAKELHRRYQVDAQIEYRDADMLQLPFEEQSFDVVAFKSVLGSLGDKARQQQAMKEIHRVLRPGGKLCLAENLQGMAWHGWLRSRFVSWSSSWRYLDLAEDQDLFAAFSKVTSTTRGVLGLLGRNETQRRLLAAVDTPLGFITPAQAKYILFAVAEK